MHNLWLRHALHISIYELGLMHLHMHMRVSCRCGKGSAYADEYLAHIARPINIVRNPENRVIPKSNGPGHSKNQNTLKLSIKKATKQSIIDILQILTGCVAQHVLLLSRRGGGIPSECL